MNRRNSVCLQIIKTLRKKSTPITAYGIAQLTKHHINLVTYHLDKLEQDQLVTKTNDGYILAPILYDNKLLDAIYAVLTPFVEDAAVDCESPEQVLNVLQVALELFLADLKKKKIVQR